MLIGQITDLEFDKRRIYFLTKHSLGGWSEALLNCTSTIPFPFVRNYALQDLPTKRSAPVVVLVGVQSLPSLPCRAREPPILQCKLSTTLLRESGRDPQFPGCNEMGPTLSPFLPRSIHYPSHHATTDFSSTCVIMDGRMMPP